MSRSMLGRWKRWLSLRGYGIVTSSLFGAITPPLAMRARFERLSAVPRERLQRKFPGLAFEDHARMQHDWPLTLPWLDESRAAWSAMRRFVEER
jgi:hypothetical protein